MIDLAELVTGFDRVLAERGVNAGIRRAEALARLLRIARPSEPGELYWLCRTAMLPSIVDLTRFHAAFLDYWNALVDANTLAGLVDAGSAQPRPQRPVRRDLPPTPAADRADPESAAAAAPFLAMAAAEERLSERDFGAMDERERAWAYRAIGRLRFDGDTRPSRRRRPAARGDRLDMRGTLRHGVRTAGELGRTARSIRRTTQRPLVFLIDVSGSMEPYARALLLYARIVAASRPRVRAFAFATRLSDLGRALRSRTAPEALAIFAREIADFGGGTRIGAALDAFAARYAQRGAARGGTIVVLSDGWEREDPARIGAALRRLRRLARAIVWVNPRKGHVGYEPLAGGMAAALPHLDAFVEGHSLRSLAAIADAVAAAGVIGRKARP